MGRWYTRTLRSGVTQHIPLPPAPQRPLIIDESNLPHLLPVMLLKMNLNLSFIEKSENIVLNLRQLSSLQTINKRMVNFQ